MEPGTWDLYSSEQPGLLLQCWPMKKADITSNCAASKIVAHKHHEYSRIPKAVVSSVSVEESASPSCFRTTTHAAVAPKISALRAFVSNPTTRAKREVKSTIIPTRKFMLWSDNNSRHTMAPTSRIALKDIEITAPAR